MSSPPKTSLSSLLALLAPGRIVLIGPDGPTLRGALDWALTTPGTRIRRERDGAGSLAHELLISEQVSWLAAPGIGATAVLIPEPELEAALACGEWELAASTTDGQALVTRGGRWLTPAATRVSAPGLMTPAPQSVPRPAGLAPADAAAPARIPHVSIIVPVHDAAPNLRRCLAALVRHTTWPAELLLIDDASADPAVAAVLAEAAELTGVRVLHNAVAIGRARTINRGLDSSSGDVVVLSENIEVGPRWLQHLVLTGPAGSGVATVTPASAWVEPFAYPAVGRVPAGLGVAAVARLLAQRPGPAIDAPTGGGACLFIRRSAIDALGGLDADSFGDAVGADGEFCLRALRRGWRHLVDGATFVHVAPATRLGDDHPADKVAHDRLDELDPEFAHQVRQFAEAHEIAMLRARVKDACGQAGAPRPRLMLVATDHDLVAGTAVHGLLRALDSEWDPRVLTSSGSVLRLWRLHDGEPVIVGGRQLGPELSGADLPSCDYETAIRRALLDHEIELVHVLGLSGDTLKCPRVAARLGLPVVVSLEDRRLLGDRNRGDRDGGDRGAASAQAAEFVQWCSEVESALSDVDAFAASSEHARDLHVDALPSLAGRPFEVIARGRRLRQRGMIATPPEAGGVVRLLVTAGLDHDHSAVYLRAMQAADREGRLKLHLLGTVPDDCADLGLRRGAVSAAQLPELASSIAPAFTAGLTGEGDIDTDWLTEAWALGTPVVAFDVGAAAERIRAHGGGVLLPADDPVEGVRRVFAAADDPDSYTRLRERATLRDRPSIDDTRDAYAALYRRALDGRRAFATRPGSRGPAHLRHGVVRMLAVVPGADGVHPGSTYVRIVQRYRHPAVSWKVSLALRYANQDPLRAPSDLALVGRTALDPRRVHSFLAELDKRGLPLLLDLDDHLLIKVATDTDYGHHHESLTALVETARLVLVSTEKLARALGQRAQRVAVVPNLVDERLFLAGVHERPRSESHGRPFRIVYIGSPTHARDLAMLRPMVEALERTDPGGFELNVVGVERPGEGQEWYRRIAVPDDCKPYPQFVHWLRAQRPRWDIAVAPLYDDEFNSYKSDLKYLEYAALGLPAIFSDREPYAAVAHGQTGLKVDDGVDAWTGAVRELREDHALRERLADAAFDAVIASRLMEGGADELLRLICAI